MPAVAPKISVIIAGHGPGPGLDETAASVLRQTYRDLEAVIVQRTVAAGVSNRSVADDPRIRVIAGEHRSAASARNVALQQARGLFICAIDAGDRMDPAYLARAARILDENTAVSFVSCWEQTVEGNVASKPDRCDLPAILAECTVSPAALVRRTALQAVGGYDERMPREGYEAWDLWIAMVERGLAGVIVPEVLIHRHAAGAAQSAMCRAGHAEPDVMRYLFDKHQASYQRHLFDVLLLLEKAACDHLQVSYALDAEVENSLTPRLQRRREELERLRQKLAPHGRAAELEAALASIQGSWSWRLTAPLRAAYDVLARVRRRGVGGRSAG